MKKAVCFLVLGLCFAGCGTTNAFMHLTPNYADLPVDELRVLAETIETIAAAGQEDFTLESTGGILVDLPDIRQALRTRVIRYPLLEEFLATGFAAEGTNGLIAVKRSSAYKKATTSRGRDRDALLVMSENENRWAIYEGLVKANQWPPRALSAVQEIFYQARTATSAPGEPQE